MTGDKRVHELKTWPQPFDAVYCGRKFHEVRADDRGFEVGDHLILREWDPAAKMYSGRSMEVLVTYITIGGSFGLPEDLVVMSIAPVRII
jgi:hypothetical protein